jgi:hypothetical protein
LTLIILYSITSSDGAVEVSFLVKGSEMKLHRISYGLAFLSGCSAIYFGAIFYSYLFKGAPVNTDFVLAGVLWFISTACMSACISFGVVNQRNKR